MAILRSPYWHLFFAPIAALIVAECVYVAVGKMLPVGLTPRIPLDASLRWTAFFNYILLGIVAWTAIMIAFNLVGDWLDRHLVSFTIVVSLMVWGLCLILTATADNPSGPSASYFFKIVFLARHPEVLSYLLPPTLAGLIFTSLRPLRPPGFTWAAN